LTMDRITAACTQWTGRRHAGRHLPDESAKQNKTTFDVEVD